MFKKLPLGRGLLAERELKAGEIFYTILQSGTDVEIVPTKDVIPYSGFHHVKNDSLVPCRALEEKPHLFFLQHHDVGNVKVRGPLTRHLPT